MSRLKDFSEQLYLFHEKENYNSIETLMDRAKEYFCNELDKVDAHCFSRIKMEGVTGEEKKKNIKDWMDDKIEKINAIVMRKSENDLSASMDMFKLLFNEDDGTVKYRNILTTVCRNTDFYRMRKTEKYEVFDRKGMFVISDENEHLVGDYRYNPSGYACLYLANNLYLAWEECRRPDFEKANFSRFVNTREMKVLDITINQTMHFREHFLMAYFTLLCSAKTTDSDKYHYEYLVPHIMMEALCMSRAKSKIKHKTIIDGIKYLSSRRYDQQDFLFKDKTLCNAYVFPQFPHSRTESVCDKLASLFKQTEPRTFFLYKTHCLNFFNRIALVSKYQESLFYQLEEQTKGDIVKKFDSE